MIDPLRWSTLAWAACVVVACAGASPQRSGPSGAERAPSATSRPSAPADPGAASQDCTSCTRDGEKARADGDPVRAMGFFDRGCRQNEAAACDAAARMYARGDGVPENDPLAVALYVRACELGHGPACGIGHTLAASQTRAAEGRALLARGCEGGNADSCNLLADAYQRGLGGSVDLAASARTFERSCELGDAQGCTQYGIACHSGHGVSADLSRAREFYGRGCDGGDLQGCGNLAVFLRDGLGGPVDVTRSVPLFERACAGGQSNACVSLGAAYFRGDGDLEADTERALELFEVACKAGAQTGCDNLDVIAKARAAVPATEPETRWTTSIGSLTIGSGERTATFEDVRSTCSALPLSLAFAVAAGDVRDCLDGGVKRRVSLAVEGGRVASSSVEPDDAVGRCVTSALGRAPLGNLSCALEATVSR